jgi:hypothetical protein
MCGSSQFFRFCGRATAAGPRYVTSTDLLLPRSEREVGDHDHVRLHHDGSRPVAIWLSLLPPHPQTTDPAEKQARAAFTSAAYVAFKASFVEAPSAADTSAMEKGFHL